MGPAGRRHRRRCRRAGAAAGRIARAQHRQLPRGRALPGRLADAPRRSVCVRRPRRSATWRRWARVRCVCSCRSRCRTPGAGSCGDVADGIGRVVEAADARIIGGNIARGPRFGRDAHRDRRHRPAGASGGARRSVTRSGSPGCSVARDARSRPGSGARCPTRWPVSALPRPMPRLREGMWLAAVGAHAMIDLSDGLAHDAAHLAAASAVHCELWADAIPRVAGATVDEALGSGEEYELLVATGPDLDAEGFAASLRRAAHAHRRGAGRGSGRGRGRVAASRRRVGRGAAR